MNRNTKIALFALAVAVGSAIIYYGTETKQGVLESCSMRADFYVTAEYSEVEVVTELVTKINSEGKSVTTNETSTETHYWSVPASNHYEAITYNGQLVRTDSGKIFSNGYYIPHMPPVIHDPRPNFDNYKEHTELTGYAGVDEELIPMYASKYLDCMVNLKQTVQYKTFFGKPLYVIFE